MPQLTTAEVHTIPIDSTGEFWFKVYGEDKISFLLDGDNTADYALDVGVDDDTPTTDNWFNAKDSFSATDTIRQVYDHPETWIRLRVTAASATAGDEARVAVSGTAQ